LPGENRLGTASLRELGRLASLRGRSLAHLPEASILTVRGPGADRHFSLIANRAHSNVAELFDEAERRLPDEDTVLVANGLIPAYPNAFFVVDAAQLPPSSMPCRASPRRPTIRR
jgi:hypothetical protein